MVRWTEASSFFPFLQFSYYPWNYAPATAEAVAAYARVHKALEPYLAEQAAGRRAPMLRPLWYDYPDQPELYPIADQFLLGSDLVAAPVLDAGIFARDISLPPGDWADAWTGERVSAHLRQWPSPCPGIPLFVHTRNPTLLATLRRALEAVPRDAIPGDATTATRQAGLNRDLNVTG